MADKPSDQCKKALVTKFLNNVPQDTVHRIVDELDTLREKVSPSEFRKFSKEFLHEKRFEIAKLRKERLVNLSKSKSRAKFYNEVFNARAEGTSRGEGLYNALAAKLSGASQNVKGINYSAERVGLVHVKSNEAFLIANLEAKGLKDLAFSNTLNKEIMQELFEMKPNGQRGISGSKEAQMIAEVIHAVQNRMHKQLKEAGLDIGYVQGYIMKQSHDSIKAKEAGFEAWAEAILPRLDAKKTFGAKFSDEKFVMEFLQEAYDTITKGKHEVADDILKSSDEFITTANYAKLGDQLNKSRSLHFKSGADFFEYNKVFGKDDLIASVNKSIHANGRAAGLIEVFGTNPQAAFEADKKRIAKLLKSDKAAYDKFMSRTNQDLLDWNFKQVSGFTNAPSDSMLARWSNAIRAVQSMASLGAAGIRSITDFVNVAAMYHSVTGEGFLSSTMKTLGEVMNNIPPSQRKEAAEVLSVHLQDNISNLMGQLGANAEVEPGFMSKAAMKFFKLNGQEFVTDVARSSAGKMLAQQTHAVSGKAFNELTPRWKSAMERFDITEADWNLIRQGVGELANGQKLIVPDLIEKLPDKGASKAALKYRMFLDTMVEFGSPQPRARAQSRLLMGTQAGSARGEAMRFMTQFKAFPSYMYDVAFFIAAADPSKPIDNLRDVFRGRGDIANLSKFALGLTAMAYVADAVIDIANNKKPKPLDDPGTWREMIVKGGAGGLYTDFVFGEAGRNAPSFGEMVLGPTAGDVGDMYELFKKAKRAGYNAATGQHSDEKLMLDTINLVSRNIPGQNIFYAKTALDWAFLDNLKEAADPGHKIRKERRLREQGRERLFE